MTKNFSRTTHLFLEKHKPQGPKYETIEFEGFTILIGLNAPGNDLVTSQAKPHDLWFHAHAPGSHVVIQTGMKDISPGVINKAVEIAATRSKAGLGVEVAMLEAKYVTKEEDHAVGQVDADMTKARNFKSQVPKMEETSGDANVIALKYDEQELANLKQNRDKVDPTAVDVNSVDSRIEELEKRIKAGPPKREGGNLQSTWHGRPIKFVTTTTQR